MAMNIHAALRWALAGAVVLPLADCGRSDATSSEAARAGGVDSTVPSSAYAAPPGEATVGDAPAHIYYELTRYDWYRQGRPLLVDGASYQLSGAPVRLRSARLEPAGSYEGVDYYRDQGSPDLVFVPVYPGYWQAFAPVEESSSTTTE